MMTCMTCYHWDEEQKICARDGCEWSGQHREAEDPACARYRDVLKRRLGVRREPKLMEISPEASRALNENLVDNVDRMGKYILQLGQLVGSMQRRMDEMERQQAAVTIRHEDVKRLQALIRMRADEVCGKYEITDRDSPRIFRAAIKKDLLKRCGVKDLHDVPAAQLPGAEKLVSGWTNIRMVMDRRRGA